MKPSPRLMSALVPVAVLSFFLSACGSGAPEAVDVLASPISSEAPVKGSVASEDSLEAEQAGGEIKVVTDANFAREVLMSDKTVLVWFWANCRGECERMTRILQEIADGQDSLIIATINVVENGVARDTYNIRQAMTMIVYQCGRPVRQISTFPKTADDEKLRSGLESQLDLHSLSLFLDRYPCLSGQ